MSGFRDILLAVMAGRQKEKDREAEAAYRQAQTDHLNVQTDTARRSLQDLNAVRSRVDSLQPYYTVDGQRPASFMDSVQPQQTNEFGIPQQQANPFKLQQPTADDRLNVMQDEFGRQGNLKQMVDVVNLRDELAKNRARVEAGQGDPAAFYRQELTMKRLEQGGKTVSGILKSGGKGALKMMWPTIASSIPELANADPDSFDTKGDLLTYDIKHPQSGEYMGTAVYRGDASGLEIVKPKAADPMEMLLTRDNLQQQREQQRYEQQQQRDDQRYEQQLKLQDRQFGQQLKLAERKGSGGGKAPAGYRWNGDSLEPIPGGPADKKATKPLPATQLSELADQRRILDTLKEVQAMADKGDVATGPVAGRAQGLASKVGLAGDGFKKLNQKLSTANNIMLKLRSGAAVTDQEYARFLQEMPTTNDPPDVIKVKIEGAIGYAQSLLDTKLDTYAEGGYRIPNNIRPGAAAAPVPAGQAAPAKKAAPAKGQAIRSADDYLRKLQGGR